jgi:hypothetical protein
MHKEESLTPAEQELESVLGQLKPAPNTLNRDELMFNAGRAAAGKKQPWQMLSGVLTVLLLCSVLIRSDMHGPRESSSPHDPEQFRIAQTTYRPVQTESPGPLMYPTLRRDIVRYGLDAWSLRQGISSSAQHKNRKQWLESMLSS